MTRQIKYEDVANYLQTEAFYGGLPANDFKLAFDLFRPLLNTLMTAANPNGR